MSRNDELLVGKSSKLQPIFAGIPLTRDTHVHLPMTHDMKFS